MKLPAHGVVIIIEELGRGDPALSIMIYLTTNTVLAAATSAGVSIALLNLGQTINDGALERGELTWRVWLRH